MSTIKHRAMSGAIASVGTFACMMVASYQTAHEYQKEVDGLKAVKFSAGVALLAGAFWAVTPSAAEHHEEVLEHTKEKTYPSIRLAIRRMISGTTSNAPSSAGTTDTTRNVYTRSTALDDGFDEDYVTDEEYAELLDAEILDRTDRLRDPFYEGPKSIFDIS